MFWAQRHIWELRRQPLEEKQNGIKKSQAGVSASHITQPLSLTVIRIKHPGGSLPDNISKQPPIGSKKFLFVFLFCFSLNVHSLAPGTKGARKFSCWELNKLLPVLKNYKDLFSAWFFITKFFFLRFLVLQKSHKFLWWAFSRLSRELPVRRLNTCRSQKFCSRNKIRVL